MSDNLRDLVAAALRGDDQWDSLSESQKAVWRADADRAIKAMRSAAALPAPAGEEVTESDLHEFMLKHSEEWDSEEAAAQAVFSRFTILAKPSQDG